MADGYSQDVVTRIFNVHWGGLAVIFGEKDLPPTPVPTPAVKENVIELSGNESRTIVGYEQGDHIVLVQGRSHTEPAAAANDC